MNASDQEYERLKQRSKHYDIVLATLVKENKDCVLKNEKEQQVLRYKLNCLRYALDASNASRLQQAELLSTELEKVQKLLSKRKNSILNRVSLLLKHIYGTYILRPLKKIFHYCLYAIFSGIKDIWVDFGKPFPRLTRLVRYGIFRSLPPNKH